MGKAVIDLQNDIINNQADLVSILRKAHLIASKLSLSEFDAWICDELNGYTDCSKVPEYRKVTGEYKAKNPAYGLVPILLPSDLSADVNVQKLTYPMSQIMALAKENQFVSLSLPKDACSCLCSDTGMILPCYFVFGTHWLTRIMNSVKDLLLDWCLQLEKGGILGEGVEFSETEVEKAKKAKQQINIYGTIINGDINGSQMVIGDGNAIEFNLKPKLFLRNTTKQL